MNYRFPILKQFDGMDCGPTCLRMIAKYYGKSISTNDLRSASYLTKEGVSLMGISHAAERVGMRTLGTKISFCELEKKGVLPCIVHWGGNHFVVVYKIKKKHVYIADPQKGRMTYTYDEFINNWFANKGDKGYVLFLEPTSHFYDIEESKEKGWAFFFSYLKPHKKLLFQILCALIFSSIVSLISPFLTKSLVDVGINGENIDFVHLILLSQVLIAVGTTFVSFVQSWINLHVGTKISIEFISDFLQKLLKLPLSFFESKSIGDILQRMGDNSRIQSYITGAFFTIIISIINFFIFSIVLLYYHAFLFTVFLAGNIVFVLWVLLFMKKRRQFDYKKFDLNSENKNIVLQLFRGIEEIKLHNVEREKRWEWEYMQARKYKLGMNILAWGQIQSSGSILINSLKNVFISFISAKAVIEGEMTLGMMMSVQFIIGQLQGPIKSFISLAYAHQDAKISIERLSEVHNMEDEETGRNNPILNLHSEEIRLENISFQYEGPNSPFILNNVNLVIPKNKVTAIVGESGSGKTTLLRLLLKFLVPTGGCIKVGDIHLSGIQNSLWRSYCGAVMQSGFLFTDTVINNVCIGDHNLDFERFFQSLKRANILSWVESLPSKYDTIIGAEGRSLSQGQKQRILIARLFYTNPDFVLLDEATSSLDANSESIVMDNLNEFCKNKTTVIIAHRLSTIKNADQIVLLKDGNIIETGKHEDLIRNKGAYLDLVEKQLSKQEFEFC